jgi:hypothetical protein
MRITPGVSEKREVKLMHQRIPRAEAFPVSASLTGDQAHLETENRSVWNELQHANEERQLIYEISWIAELGTWRCFLRSSRVSNTK